MTRHLSNLGRDKRGAVAPTVALALFALIGAGGIAFDYARLASLDTELQQAADQAALAAATQLDQQAGAVARATAAAQGLFVNSTLFANDGSASGRNVTIPSVLFYASKADAEAANGQACPTTNAVTADASARFVCVQTGTRIAKYAMTPVVNAFASGAISAMAVAGLGSAICKVPPVMICNPDEPDPNSNPNFAFDANAYAGRGLRLITVGNGPTAPWAAGNFGYLDVVPLPGNPNTELREALGWTTAPGDCSGLDGVQTRTGAGTPVTQALNTRFDIYEKANTGNGNAASCPTGGFCPPSINTTKDAVRKSAPNAAGKCGFPTNTEWELPTKRYLPSSGTADLDLTVAANVPDSMGHPRDKCHAISQNGSCALGKIGDGNWDRSAYFWVNYGWNSSAWPTNIAMGVSPITTATPTRNQVYSWEIANRGATIGGQVILSTSGRPFGTGPTANIDFDRPRCSQLQGTGPNGYGDGVVPGGSNPDRRRISAAVLNCKAHSVNGGGNTVYPVLKWVELFLVEPSLQRDRTDPNDVYVEIVGETQIGAGQTAGQVVRRDLPYLVK